MKVSKAEVWPIVKNAFPDYKGRKFKIEITEKIYFSDLNFDGGSRNQYVAVSLKDGTATTMGFIRQFDPREGKECEIPENVAVVRHTYFCGHDLGITIHVNPKNAPARLTAA